MVTSARGPKNYQANREACDYGGASQTVVVLTFNLSYYRRVITIKRPLFPAYFAARSPRRDAFLASTVE